MLTRPAAGQLALLDAAPRYRDRGGSYVRAALRTAFAANVETTGVSALDARRGARVPAARCRRARARRPARGPGAHRDDPDRCTVGAHYLFPIPLTADVIDDDSGRTHTRRQATYLGASHFVEHTAPS